MSLWTRVSDATGFSLASFVMGAIVFWSVAVPSIVAREQPAIVVSSFDPGGSVGTYGMWWERVRDSGARVIIDGECNSACTMFLGIVPPERVCYTERATLGFHQVSVNGKADPEMTERFTRLYYPPIVLKWIETHGPLTLDMKYAHPSEFKGYIRKCTKREYTLSWVNW